MWVVRRPQHVLVGESLPKPSQLHSHHVLQLTLSVSGLLMPVIAGVALPPAAGILVGSNVPHTLSGHVVHVFVDPLEPLGLRLRGLLGARPYLAVDPRQAASFWGGDARAWLEGSPFPDSDEPVEHLLAELERGHGNASIAPPDGRIRSVIATLKGSLDVRAPLELLADVARLSPTRLTHLFTEQVGMPIKQYVVWLRLVAVLEALRPGKQLGALAHDTGFPDQAAFNRTYRKAWGRTPSSFARSNAVRSAT
ncbi:MAG: helix-turn-helix domain-containing protein [Myxococcales bacterium]